MRRAATALLAGSLALTGCSDEPAEITDEDIARIEQSLVRGSELSWELIEAESRVAGLCMQDEGFTVHHPIKLFGNGIPHRFMGFNSAYSRIPTVEQAELFGFGLWVSFTDTDAALEMSEDPAYIAFTAEEAGWWNPDWDADHEEFKAMGEEYGDAWMEAFLGPEGFAAYQEATAMDPDEFMEADLEQPPLGGCEKEAVEAVYGGPEVRETEDGPYWSRPTGENPIASIGEEGFHEEFSARFADEEAAFLTCVEERGYGQWEFDEFGRLPFWDYLNEVYGEVSGMPSEGEFPELSEEAEDAEDPVAFEFAMALDFADCAEDAGLRDGTEEAWARMYADQLVDREAEVFAWEQEIEGYLANAQEYLAWE